MRRAGAIFAAVVAVVLALAAPAFAGRIAYSSGAPSQVFAVPAGGGPAQQITHDPAGAAHPDWSRDGRLVAYDVGGARLAVAGADGSGEHFITIEMSAIDPSWSPDSSQLAFTGVQYDDTGNAEDTSLYVTQADGSNYVRIGGGTEPDWSPAGDWIVYRSNPADSDGCPGIWRKRPDGSDNSPVAPGTPDGSVCAGGGSDPSFSPNGKRVAFVSGDGTTIFTTSVYGGKKRRVVHDPAPKTSPVFSPNGHTIVYSTGSGLWKVSAKGGRPKRIAGSAASVAWQPG
jgi:Tol biopolymer transport system component